MKYTVYKAYRCIVSVYPHTSGVNIYTLTVYRCENFLVDFKPENSVYQKQRD
nr:MAG TPA: hypothetical protein [Caudoviricetes sp.]